ncbi:uncharacterized protein MAM_00594 [Metarhizium album ARSEF 1941]|uniref:DUF8035 domain-containing protein n=1 Tax=Metarhizium album (strain ARSEF 1941) TaxID=1081103 RepID=A0A0B2X746_METAS|nr:uncharacterized protein MAM_00594 [Metarhizium album ARSEF 1941]KHO01593.1 hypothetical protein MAM_00594 [Metarhizium album ARSEF 1941]
MGSERWQRDRFEDDRYYMRGGRSRERSEDRHDRSRYREDDFVRDRRYYDDEPRYEPRREPVRHPDFGRRIVMEKERDRDYYRDSSPPRPSFLRRQSSLDTYDRRPLRNIFDQREEYPPPARREDIFRDDYRAAPYAPIPLPKARGLPSPGRRDDRYYDYRPESDFYPEDEYRPMPERLRGREFIRERERRDRSRESRGTRTHTHRSSSRSSSSSSSSGGGATIRSEYPKKGKTKIPVRLVSKRALIDLGYPYVEEDNSIIVQKALGQENIDELLKLSEDYMKVDQEVTAARSSAGDLVEERIEERKQKVIEAHVAAPPPPPPMVVPAPPPAPVVVPPPPAPVPVAGPAPVVVDAAPRSATGHVDIVDKTVIREVSPSRSSSSWESSHTHRHKHRHHHHDDGALVVVPRSRSRSRTRRDIRAEIKALERELVHRPRSEVEREVVRTERLPDGQLVVYEEEVKRTVARPKPPRIEKDKKGPPPALVRAMLSTLT